MSIPKPRIKPKAGPCRQQGEPPLHDPPSYPGRDPPVFTERSPGAERKAPERVVFHEDDCLR